MQFVCILTLFACSPTRAQFAHKHYDSEKAIVYAETHCATGKDLGGAEFVFHAIQYGGLFPWGHQAITSVTELIAALTNQGWVAGNTGTNSCARGDVILYAEAQTAPGCHDNTRTTQRCPKGPYAHVALAKGNGFTWQHDSNLCNGRASWSVSKGEMLYNSCYSPPRASKPSHGRPALAAPAAKPATATTPAPKTPLAAPSKDSALASDKKHTAQSQTPIPDERAHAASLRGSATGTEFETKIFPWLLLWEGGYSNIKEDGGGATQ